MISQKIFKYLYKLNNNDVTSSKFGTYLSKLNYYYNLYGGAINIQNVVFEIKDKIIKNKRDITIIIKENDTMIGSSKYEIDIAKTPFEIKKKESYSKIQFSSTDDLILLREKELEKIIELIGKDKAYNLNIEESTTKLKNIKKEDIVTNTSNNIYILLNNQLISRGKKISQCCHVMRELMSYHNLYKKSELIEFNYNIMDFYDNIIEFINRDDIYVSISKQSMINNDIFFSKYNDQIYKVNYKIYKIIMEKIETQQLKPNSIICFPVFDIGNTTEVISGTLTAIGFYPSMYNIFELYNTFPKSESTLFLKKGSMPIDYIQNKFIAYIIIKKLDDSVKMDKVQKLNYYIKQSCNAYVQLFNDNKLNDIENDIYTTWMQLPTLIILETQDEYLLNLIEYKKYIVKENDRITSIFIFPIDKQIIEKNIEFQQIKLFN
jgi:hypothetical protein